MKACILLLALAVAVQAQKFEPVTCDWEKEMMCPGKWNEDWTKQMTADFCIPMKNGDCYNYCPMDCGKDMMCPGGMDTMGCAMPDSCHPGSMYFQNQFGFATFFDKSPPQIIFQYLFETLKQIEESI